MTAEVAAASHLAEPAGKRSAEPEGSAEDVAKAVGPVAVARL
jgi:hypothetical protein